VKTLGAALFVFSVCTFLPLVTQAQPRPKPIPANDPLFADDFRVSVIDSKTKDAIAGASVTVTRLDGSDPDKTVSYTDTHGMATVTRFSGPRKGRFRVTVSKTGYDSYDTQYDLNGTESRPIQFRTMLWRKSVTTLAFEVVGENMEVLDGAKVEGTFTGMTRPYFGILTGPGKNEITLPAERPAGAVTIRASFEGYEDAVEHPSLDPPPGLIRIHLTRKRDARFIGTWKMDCKIDIILNADGTAAWDDHREGPAKSMYESIKLEGEWSSTGNSVDLFLTKAPLPERTNRLGHVTLTLEKDGKLSVPYCGYGSKLIRHAGPPMIGSFLGGESRDGLYNGRPST